MENGENKDERIELSVLTQTRFGENVYHLSAREKKGAGEIEIVATIVLLETRKNRLGVQLYNKN